MLMHSVVLQKGVMNSFNGPMQGRYLPLNGGGVQYLQEKLCGMGPATFVFHEHCIDSKTLAFCYTFGPNVFVLVDEGNTSHRYVPTCMS